MSVQEFKEKPTLKCCKEENCGMDECEKPCETAEWELAKYKFNLKCKTLKYPGQERIGRSNKLFIHIGNEQAIYITAQARESLDWKGVNEPLFVAELIRMLQGPFNAIGEMRDGWVLSARLLIVSKSEEGEEEDDDRDTSFIRIDVKRFEGLKNNGEGYQLPWRGDYPLVKPEDVLQLISKQEVGKQ